VTKYPSFRCWATAIHLPDGGSKWKWDYDSDPIDRHLGAVDYWRLVDMRDGVIRTVMSTRSDVPEITADQALEVKKGLETFNSNTSTVYQVAVNDRGSSHKRLSELPFQADTDWTSPDTPCVPNTQLAWIPAPTPVIKTIRSFGGVTLGLGHRQQFLEKQKKLGDLIREADQKGCVVTPEDRALSTAPYPDTPAGR
jgi:hypothetical protein